MNAYERQVLLTWLEEDEKPASLTTRLIRGFSGRIGSVLRAAEILQQKRITTILEQLRGLAREAIVKTLEQAASARQFDRVEEVLSQLGSTADTASDIRMLPLEIKDEACRRLGRAQTMTVGAAGAAAGLATSLFELVPGLQSLIVPTILTDLATTFYLMAQNAVQLGYCYGYSLHNAEDLPHFLYAMSPATEDGLLIEAKVTAHLAIRESGFALTKAVSEHAAASLLSSASPAITKLIDVVATRMAVQLAEKELGILLPVAGAVIQGSVNAAFCRASLCASKRYFQRLHLIDRYGENYLDEQLRQLRGAETAERTAV